MKVKQTVSKTLAVALSFLMMLGAVPVQAAAVEAALDVQLGLTPEYIVETQDIAAPEPEEEFTPSEPSGVTVRSYTPGIAPFSTDPDDMRDLDASVFADLGLPVSDGQTDALPPMGPVATFGADNEIYVHASAPNRGTHISLRRPAPFAEGYGFNRCAHRNYAPNVVFGAAYRFADLTGSDRFRTQIGVLGNNGYVPAQSRPAYTRCFERNYNVLWRYNSRTPQNLVYVNAIELNLNDPTGETAGRKNFVAELQVYRSGNTHIYRARLVIFRLTARRIPEPATYITMRVPGSWPPRYTQVRERQSQELLPAIGNHRTQVASYNLGVVYDFTRGNRFGAASEMMEFDAITDIAIGDLNGDGIDDIAVRFARNSVRVLYGRTNGVNMPHRDISLQVGENTSNAHNRWMSIPIVSLDISDLRGDGQGQILSMAVGMSAYRRVQNGPLFIGGSGDGRGASIRMYASGLGANPTLSRVFTHTIAANENQARPLALNLTGARVDGRIRLVAAGIGGVTPGVSTGQSRSIRYFIFDFEGGRFRVLRDNDEIANGVTAWLHNLNFFHHAEAQRHHQPPVAIAAAALDGRPHNDTIMIGGYFYEMNVAGNVALLNRKQFEHGPNSGDNIRMSMRHNVKLNWTREPASRLWIGEVRVGEVSYRGPNNNGREQILMVVGSRWQGYNYHYSISVAEKYHINPNQMERFFDEHRDGWVIAQEAIVHQAEVNRGYPRNQGAYLALALPDVTGNTMLTRFTGQSYRVYTNPIVKAVLIAAPIFPELIQFDDYTEYWGGSTTYSSGQEVGHGVTLGATVGVGIYAKKEFSGVAAAEVEMEAFTNFSYDFTHMWSHELSTEFTTSATSDNVIVYTVPYLLFGYELFNPDTREWEPMMISVPQEAITTLMTVDRFDAIAMATIGDELTPLRQSNGGRIINTIQGEPASYINAFDHDYLNWTPFHNPEAPGGSDGWHPSSNSAPGSAISVSRSVTHSYEHGFNVEVGISGKVGFGAGFLGTNAIAGVTMSAGASAGYIHTRGRTVTYGGTVEFLPRDAANYGFDWRFGYADYRGISVLGFETRFVMRGPRHPHSLEVVNFGENFIEVEWQGSLTNWDGTPTTDMSARYYVYVRDQGQDDYERINEGTGIIFNPAGMSYRIDGLHAGDEIEIAIRRQENGFMSLLPAEWQFARTFIHGESILDQPKDVDGLVGGDVARFYVNAIVGGVTNAFEFQWQRRTPGEDWEDIPGANTPELEFVVTMADNGDQFRARLRRRGSLPFFTNHATLSVYSVRPIITLDLSTRDITVGDTVTLTAELLHPVGGEVPASRMRFDIVTRDGTYTLRATRVAENTFSAEWTPILPAQWGNHHRIAAVFNGNEYMARAETNLLVQVQSRPPRLTLAGSDYLLTGDIHDLAPLEFDDSGGLPHPRINFSYFTVSVFEYAGGSRWVPITDGYSIRGTTFTSSRAGRFRITATDDHDPRVTATVEITVRMRQVFIRPADVTVYADDADNVPGRQFDFVVDGHMSEMSRNSLLQTLSVQSDGPGSQVPGTFPINIVPGLNTQLALLILGQNYGEIIFESGTYTVLTARFLRNYGIELSGLSATNFHTFAVANHGYRAQEPLVVQLQNTGNVPTRDLTITFSGANPDRFTIPSMLPDDEYFELCSIDEGEGGSFEVVPVLGLDEGTHTAVVTIENENGTIRENFTVSFTVGPPVTLGGSVAITGTATFGETLTANTAGLTTDPAGNEIGIPAFQWNRGGVPIPDEVHETYTLARADVGQIITVTVTTSATVGEVTSAGTSEVARATAPTIIFPARGSDIFYGQALSNSVFYDADTRFGTFAWATPDYLPAAGDDQDFSVIFTPNNATLAVYEFPSDPLTQNVYVNVSPVEIINVTNFAELQGAFANAPTHRAIAVRAMNNIEMRGGIRVPVGADITLFSGATNGAALFQTTADRHFAISSGAALTLGLPNDDSANNIAITRTVTGIGGGVNVTGGTFVMHGGTISGNRAHTGGGVFVGSGGAFTMHGGAISGNTAVEGGGLFIRSVTANMHGGTISGNIATRNGGGVSLAGTAAIPLSGMPDIPAIPAFFNMYDGEIVFNLAENYYGGVHTGGIATFTRTGGTIAPNFDSASALAHAITLVNVGTGAFSHPFAFATAGETIEFFAGTRTGYVFENWTTIPANLFGGQAENANVTIEMPGADVTATANWRPTDGISVTIVDGGDGATENLTAREGESVTLNPGTRVGYTFTGWSSAEVTITGNRFTMPATAVTVTANWEPLPSFAVTIEDGGEGATVSRTAREGETITLDAGTRDGFIFSGWSSAVTIEDAESLTGASFVMPGTAVTVTALWSPIITIVDGGTGYYASPNPAFQGSIVTLNAGTREHYKFTGWTSANVTIANADCPTSATFTMPDEAVTVTADWERIIIMGDVDDNGVVNIVDAFRLRQYLAGHPVTINHLQARVTGGAVPSISDVFRLRQFLAGHPVSLEPMSIGGMIAPLSSSGSVQISVSGDYAQPGEYVDIVVSLDENPGVALMQLLLDFDATALEVVRVTPAASQFIFAAPALNANPLPLNFEPAGFDTVFDTGTLVTVRFRVLAEYGEIPVSLSYALVTDISMSAWFDVTVTGGFIVSGGTQLADAPEMYEQPAITEPEQSYPIPEESEFDAAAYKAALAGGDYQ